MNGEELRSYCLSKKEVTENLPFDEVSPVYKVGGKIFLICSIDASPVSFNVKCDPARATDLRERYPCVRPGFHMNKQHWNTVIADGSVSDSMIRQWIDDSYLLVLSSLTKKERQRIDSES